MRCHRYIDLSHDHAGPARRLNKPAVLKHYPTVIRNPRMIAEQHPIEYLRFLNPLPLPVVILDEEALLFPRPPLIVHLVDIPQFEPEVGIYHHHQPPTVRAVHVSAAMPERNPEIFAHNLVDCLNRHSYAPPGYSGTRQTVSGLPVPYTAEMSYCRSFPRPHTRIP